MVRRGVWKHVDRDQWRDRREVARGFLQAALQALEIAEEGQDGNPIMSNALLAAIAYADALTVKFGGIQNKGDHSKIGDALLDALGDRALKEQLTRLTRLIRKKNQIQYGFEESSITEAREYVAHAERFAAWAEAELARS
jgi:hypothetical protein